MKAIQEKKHRETSKQIKTLEQKIKDQEERTNNQTEEIKRELEKAQSFRFKFNILVHFLRQNYLRQDYFKLKDTQ